MLTAFANCNSVFMALTTPDGGRIRHTKIGTVSLPATNKSANPNPSLPKFNQLICGPLSIDFQNFLKLRPILFELCR